MDFTFLSMRSTGRNSYLFTGTTGQAAIEALAVGNQLLSELKAIKENISIENIDDTEFEAKKVSMKLHSELPIAFLKKVDCLQIMVEIKLRVKQVRADILNELLEKEMKKVHEINAKSPYIVHFLSCANLMKPDSLHKATQHVTDKPIMIISLTQDKVQARCCVPTHLASEKFNAKSWIQQVAQIYRAKVTSTKAENPKETCNLKEKMVHPKQFESARQEALLAANEYAKTLQ